MDTASLIDAGWYFLEYFMPELRAAVIGGLLLLFGVWLLVVMRLADGIR